MEVVVALSPVTLSSPAPPVIWSAPAPPLIESLPAPPMIGVAAVAGAHADGR